MNALFIYMIKMAIYLAGFFLVYWLFLNRDTLYSRNRVYILLSLIASLILPLITVQTIRPLNMPVFGRVLSEIFVSDTALDKSSSITSASGVSLYKLVFIVYIAGALFFGLKLIFDIAELIFIISRNKTGRNRIIMFHGLNTSGFSVFGHIFVNDRLTPEETKEIIKHEQNHLSHNHSFDIVLIELLRVFQWFNPIIHLFSRSLRAVHEFQADEECISRGISVNNYQKLLMNQVFKSRIFTISNSFSNPSLIKKRMIMMTKKRSGTLANIKLLMVLPVIAAVMVFISSCSQSNKSADAGVEIAPLPPPPPPPPPPVGDISSEAPFVEVDEMPVFKGGDAGLIQYIAENTRYPENAKTKGIQGKVIVRFAVEADGSIDKISILKGVDPELDMEAIRVVQTLPKFEKPGIKDGKDVAVWYMIPINFTLK
jgi:TonB family protein